MENGDRNQGETALTGLVRETIGDAQRIFEQRLDQLRDEFRDEFRKARDAAVSMGAGTAMAGVGGILLGFMLVHLLNRLTGLPLWACHGLVGGAMGAAGTQLLVSGASQASEVQLAPSQTVESLSTSLAGGGESARAETP